MLVPYELLDFAWLGFSYFLWALMPAISYFLALQTLFEWKTSSSTGFPIPGSQVKISRDCALQTASLPSVRSTCGSASSVSACSIIAPCAYPYTSPYSGSLAMVSVKAPRSLDSTTCTKLNLSGEHTNK